MKKLLGKKTKKWGEGARGKQENSRLKNKKERRIKRRKTQLSRGTYHSTE